MAGSNQRKIGDTAIRRLPRVARRDVGQHLLTHHRVNHFCANQDAACLVRAIVEVRHNAIRVLLKPHQRFAGDDGAVWQVTQ
jgi:hypothetical protein